MGLLSGSCRTLLACFAAAAAFGSNAGIAAAAFPGQNGLIVFEHSGAIATIKADGTGFNLGPLGSDPSWSADGRQIVFVCTPCSLGVTKGNLWVMNADFTNPRDLGLAGLSPSWSPDNDHIVFQQGSSIKTISLSSGAVSTLLTRIPAGPNGTPPAHDYSQPAWSPDGSKIAVTDTSVTIPRTSTIDVMPAAGGTPTAVTTVTAAGQQDSAADWSPDGSSLVFSHQGTGGLTLERIPAAGGTPTALPANRDSWSDPGFSPDGSLIAATSAVSSVDIWTMSASGGTFAQVTHFDGTGHPDWQPQPAPANTPTGPNVDVFPADQTGATPVEVFFDQVTLAGDTTLTTSSTGPPPPSGFSLGSPPTYYYLHTTASFTSAQVCITDPTVSATSVLLHYDASGTNPQDVTDYTLLNNPDPVGHVICAQLSSFSPFVIAQKATADTTPPAISLLHTPDGQHGWNVTAPVAVTVTATDPDDRLAGPPTCTDAANGSAGSPLTVSGSEPNFTVSVSGEGVHEINCTASDPPGNHASATDTVKIDTHAPLVSYTGSAPSYTIEQAVNITCTASDPTPGSGLASTTCATVTGPAYTFAVGTNTFSADATDNAGNKGHGSVSFTVQVTPTSLCQLTKRFVEGSSEFASLPPVVRAAIDAKLTALCTALANANLTNPQLKALAVAAYDKGVQSLAAFGWVTSDQAATLTRLAAGL